MLSTRCATYTFRAQQRPAPSIHSSALSPPPSSFSTPSSRLLLGAANHEPLPHGDQGRHPAPSYPGTTSWAANHEPCRTTLQVNYTFRAQQWTMVTLAHHHHRIKHGKVVAYINGAHVSTGKFKVPHYLSPSRSLFLSFCSCLLALSLLLLMLARSLSPSARAWPLGCNWCTIWHSGLNPNPSP